MGLYTHTCFQIKPLISPKNDKIHFKHCYMNDPLIQQTTLQFSFPALAFILEKTKREGRGQAFIFRLFPNLLYTYPCYSQNVYTGQTRQDEKCIAWHENIAE